MSTSRPPTQLPHSRAGRLVLSRKPAIAKRVAIDACGISPFTFRDSSVLGVVTEVLRTRPPRETLRGARAPGNSGGGGVPAAMNKGGPTRSRKCAPERLREGDGDRVGAADALIGRGHRRASRRDARDDARTRHRGDRRVAGLPRRAARHVLRRSIAHRGRRRELRRAADGWRGSGDRDGGSRRR